MLLKLLARTRWLRQESGMDLIEYGLTVGLVALGATAAMSSVANQISIAIGQLMSLSGTYIS